MHGSSVDGEPDERELCVPGANDLEPRFNFQRATARKMLELDIGISTGPAKTPSFRTLVGMKSGYERILVAPLEINPNIGRLPVDDQGQQAGKDDRDRGPRHPQWSESDHISTSGPLRESPGRGGQSSLSR
jgi:hypothetical protein